jgi:hypothetical protein
MAARFGVEVLAYVLMNLHYHLLQKEKDKDFGKRSQRIKAQTKMCPLSPVDEKRKLCPFYPERYLSEIFNEVDYECGML